MINLFLLQYSLFSLIRFLSHSDPPFGDCDTATLPDNSSYRTNLNNLLSNLSSYPAPAPKFYNFSVGTDSDRIYGRFMCYAYFSEDDCNTCLRESLPQDIRKLCMHKYEAVVWEEECMFRYSTQNFFGRLNDTNYVQLDNRKNVSDPERFRSVVNETLRNLTDLAAFHPSFQMHWSGSKPMTDNKTLYAFVQCSKDLSQNDCNTCLKTAIKNILDCCYFSQGARLLSHSCYLRYECYDFYEGPARLFIDKSTNGNSLSKDEKQFEKWILVFLLGSGILALAALGCCLLYVLLSRQTGGESKEVIIHDRDNLNSADSNFGLQHNLNSQDFPFIDMKIIEEATANFSDCNKLGEGGFGPVFKGILPDGREIAVKRLSSNSEQGPDEFGNELLLIHKLQHVNIVKLLGFSVRGEEKVLIYEYMPNGSLHGLLSDSEKCAQLNWNTRLNIIKGVARGLLYLHQDSQLKIIHRDLKPSNVLLDANMNPKISDFGVARIFGTNDGVAKTKNIVGTYGYMAPELAMDGLYSIKSDVFSFGVLLLEIITGRRNAGFHHTGLGSNLLAYAWKLWNEGGEHELINPLMAEDFCSREEISRCLHIGLLCVQEDARERPSMSSVVLMLNTDNVNLSRPQRPPFKVANFNNSRETCSKNFSVNALTMSELLPR